MTNYYNSLVSRSEAVPKKSTIASRCWQLCLFMMLSLFIGQASFGQTVVIGAGANAGTTGSNAGPIYRSSAGSAFDFSQHMYLYTAAELSAAGINPGATITSIAWFKNNAFGTAATNTSSIWKVTMKNSAVAPGATWSSGSFATQTTGATTVYNNTAQAIPLTTGFITLTLSTPFVYTGGSLEVGSDWNCSIFAGSPATGGFTWKSDNLTNQSFGSSNSVAAMTMTLQTIRPQLQITSTPAPPCSGTPAPGNTVASSASVCGGSNFTLTLQNLTGGSGVTYVWESADDMAFTSGVTTLASTGSSQITSQTTAKYYRCSVTCSGSTTVSTPVAVAMSGFVDCYCSTGLATTGGTGDIMTGVTFGGYTSGAIGTNTQPYFTSVVNTPVVLTQGTNVPMTITMGTDTTQHSAVWIDFDHSGTFDASENLALSTVAAGGSVVVNYTLAMPATGLLGQTRMRVRGGADGVYTAAGACAGLTYGETEDYLVDIIANSNCSGTPAPGSTVSSTASACSGINFTLSLQTATFGAGVTYLWESADDMAFTVNVASLGTADSQVTSQTVAKYYRCSVTCSGSTTISTPVAVGLNAFTACYCTPTVSFGGTGDTVAGVTFGAFTSGAVGTNAQPYYTSVANTPIAIVSPSTGIPMTITMGADGTQHSAVWIDFDQSGTFDASENLALSTVAATGGAVVSYTLNIPSGATVGQTRMRVRGGSDSAYTAAGSCATLSYGETEDYLVDISAAAPCATPTPGNTVSTAASVCVGSPFTLSVQNATTGSGVSFQWESADDMAFTTGVVALGTSETQAVASQTTAKYYRCNVTCTTGPDTVASTPVLVAQNGPLACYCTPVTTTGCGDGDVIAKVVLNTLSNDSGTGCPSDPVPGNQGAGNNGPGYSDYTGNTALTTTLQAGTGYSCTVSAGQYSEWYGAWIDYNDDGVFDNPAERIGFTAAAVTGSGTAGVLGSSAAFPIVLSCSPPVGVHRLRVRAMFGLTAATVAAQMTPCGANVFGETEDYLVTITAADPCPAPSTLTATAATTTSATLGWKQGCVETAWDVFVQTVDASVPTGATTPTTAGITTTSAPGFGTYDVSGLTAGLAYEYYVRSSCDAGAGLFSTWAGPYTFITVAPGCTSVTTPAVTTGIALGVATVINWIAPPVSASQSAATSYDVYSGQTSGALVLAGNFVSGPLNFTINAYGTTYVQVIPKNASGVAVGCIETAFVTVPDPCAGVNPVGDTFANPIVIGALTSTPYSNSGNTLDANCWRDDYTTVSTPGNALARASNDVFYKFDISDFCNTTTIGVCSGSITDTFLHILDSTGASIFTDDDSCTTPNGNGSLLTLTNLPVGTYYAVVEAYGANIEGTYTIDITYTGAAAVLYYTDADGDGYGSAAAVAVASCSPIAGKVTNNTDCDDTKAAVNPAAAEIAYDGIDNNCDGSFDEGFPPLSTSLRAALCGTTLPFIYTSIATPYVPATGITGYRFKAKNMTTLAEQTIDRGLFNWFRLNQLPVYDFATTYEVSVELQRDGVWLGYYGDPCSITTPGVPVINQCGQTIAAGGALTTTALTGVTQYTFQVTNIAAATTQTFNKPSNILIVNQIPGYLATTAYSVSVAIKTAGGALSLFGEACTINPAPATRFGTSVVTTTGTEFKAVGAPNPFETNFTLNVTTVSDEKVQIAVYDMIGKQLELKEVNATDANELVIGANYPSGVYNVIVSQGVNAKSLRMIKR